MALRRSIGVDGAIAKRRPPLTAAAIVVSDGGCRRVYIQMRTTVGELSSSDVPVQQGARRR